MLILLKSLCKIFCIFQVVYKEKDSDTAPDFWTVEGNTSHSVQLTGLGKYVLYEIQVLAFTRIGDGRCSSPSILERTLDDGKLTFPSNFNLSAVAEALYVSSLNKCNINNVLFQMYTFAFLKSLDFCYVWYSWLMIFHLLWQYQALQLASCSQKSEPPLLGLSGNLLHSLMELYWVSLQ